MSTLYYLVPEQTPGRLDGESHLQYWKRRLLRGKRQLPIGGAKIIYQHCDILNSNGISAIPVHLGDFIVDWFPHRSKPICRENAMKVMTKSDILVCPEVIPEVAADFPCETKVAFIQNWALAEFGTGEDKRYEDFGFSNLLTCSTYLKTYMKNKSALPCDVVINGIDLDVFHAKGRNAADCKVVVLNRRNIDDARNAIGLLSDTQKRGVEFQILENQYSQAEIATFLREADIFLAIGYPEGFALPPLEAMACGCAVVGFTGGGGLEHMIDDKTALVASDGNVEELAHCLERVLANQHLKERIRNGGIKKSQDFSLENMERQLLQYTESLQLSCRR